MKAGRNPITRAAEHLLSASWGRYTLVSLYTSLLSGIILALQYDPGDPFYSTTTIELIVPFGEFWRSLHYFSSQLCFLFLLIHLAVTIVRNDHQLSASAWLRITSSLILALFFLFTGYVLRGDATGESAGIIAEHITLSLPLLGRPLNYLLFDITANAIRKVYVHHLVTLVIIGAYCCWPHLRRYGWTVANRWGLVAATLLLAVLFRAPMEADHPGLTHIAGPWFFLGLQELLRFLPPLWAGIVFPATVVLALLFLPSCSRIRSHVLTVILLWLAVYLILTWFSFNRA